MDEKPTETTETPQDIPKDTIEQTTVEDSQQAPQKTEQSTKTFFIALGIFIILLVGIFMIPRFFHEDSQTLTDLHQDNLITGAATADSYVYNGYSFVRYDGLWYTQIMNQLNGQLYDIPLHYGPKNVTDIVITGNLNDYFTMLGTNDIGNYTLQTYLTFDPNDEQMGYVALATGELTQNLAQTFSLAFIPACTTEGPGCEDVPIVTCDSTDAPVLYLKSGGPTVVYADGNCITLQGEEFELVRAVDRFLLKMYNVMI